jgi:AraC-like DNA-binding protein
MARPAKDRRAHETLDAPLSPTEESRIEFSDSGKPYPVVEKHGGRDKDRAVDPKVFEDGKLTKSKKTAQLFRRAVALKLADWSIPDIAQELGVAPGWLTRAFSEFQQNVDQESIAQRLDKTAVPLAVDNLIHGLLAGDKDMTLETLKGRGFFKRHSDGSEGLGGTKEIPPLRIEFVSPAGAAAITMGGDVSGGTTGKVVGAVAVPLVPGTPQPLELPPADAIDTVAVVGVPLAPHDE